MSGITGIWNLDGEPVSREVLATMSARLAHRGPDGENLLLCGSAGFAYQSLHVTPESLQEVQPVQHPSGPVLVWDGRLDNREELTSSLPHPGVPSESPDSSIVLAAYVAFGEDFLRRLDGDFALGLFDPTQRQLLLARDAMGGRTLYHCRFGQHLLFASEIKALLAHPKVHTAPNDQAVAEWLYRIPDYSDRTRTFFENIRTVPAGHVFRCTPDHQSLRHHWDFDLGKELRLKHHEDYVAAYKETFFRAVRRRMRSAFPIAMTVSGGLDSSSIYCVAQTIARQEPTPDLIGIALVGQDPRSNEVEYQSAIEVQYGVVLHKIPTSVANMAGPKGAWHSEGPYLKWEVWRSVLALAAGGGAKSVLSGYFGDNILTNPHYLLDLLAQGKFFTAGSHLRRYFHWWEGLSGKQKALQLYRDLKGYLVPDGIRPAYHWLRRKSQLGRKGHIPYYSDRLASAAELLKDRICLLELPPCRAHVKIIGHYLYSRLLAVRLDMEAKIDAEFPCDSSHPFRDRDLVSLVMSMPGEVVYRDGSRSIHREAMRGILPEMIRLRKSKAAFLEPARLGAIHDFNLLNRKTKGAAARLGYLVEDTSLAGSLDALRHGLEDCQDAILPWLMNDLTGLEEWSSAFFSSATENPRL